MSAIAVVGLDRQIHLARAGGLRQLSMDLGADPLLRWGRPDMPRSAWSWPSFSPDQNKLACIELPAGEDLADPARVQVLHSDGLRQQVLFESHGRVPIYCSWSPDGTQVAVVLQDEEELSLTALSLDGSPPRELDVGAPLFFSWLGKDVLVHAGSGGPKRVVLHRARDEDMLLDGTPGAFCVPLALGGYLWHVQRQGGLEYLVRTDQAGQTETLRPVHGLVALVADGDSLLLGQAPAGPGSPYKGVHRVDLRSGLSSQLSEQPCLAFYALPKRGEIATVAIDNQRNCLAWHTVDSSGLSQERAAFWPSREFLWSLQFFEQFSLSHPPVDPRGERLVFAGHRPGADPHQSRSEVFVLDLDSGGPARSLCSGSFACFPHV